MCSREYENSPCLGGHPSPRHASLYTAYSPFEPLEKMYIRHYQAPWSFQMRSHRRGTGGIGCCLTGARGGNEKIREKHGQFHCARNNERRRKEVGSPHMRYLPSPRSHRPGFILLRSRSNMPAASHMNTSLYAGFPSFFLFFLGGVTTAVSASVFPASIVRAKRDPIKGIAKQQGLKRTQREDY